MNSLQLFVVVLNTKEGSHCNHNRYKYVKGVDGAGETAKARNFWD